MTAFEKVNKIWSDLENAYNRGNKGLTRMEFLKKLVMYDSGEAALRNLVRKVSDDRGDAIDGEVEKLTTKLQTAVKHIAENPDAEIMDLNKFVCEKTELDEKSPSLSFYLPSVGLDTVEVTIEDLLKEGRIYPSKFIDRKRGSGIKQEVVKDYYFYCEGRRELARMIEQTEYGTLMVLHKAVTKFYEESRLRLPLIVTNTETLRKILAAVTKTNDLQAVAEVMIDNTPVNLYYVTVGGVHHCILEINL